MRVRPCVAALVLGVCLSGGAVPAAARHETYYRQLLSGSEAMLALDGVVAVQHPLGDAQRVKNRVLRALPGWRSKSLFAFQGASAETPTFTLFAHPDASAEVVGFSGIEDAGPSASEIIAQLEVFLAGEHFLSPLLVNRDDHYYYGATCGRILRNELSLGFDADVAPGDREQLIASFGGVVLSWDDFGSVDYYRVGITGARTGLEVLEVADQLEGHPLLRWLDLVFEYDTIFTYGCGGPAGAPTGGGTGTGGGGVQPLAVPTLGPAAQVVLAMSILVAGALVLGRRRL